MAAEIGKEIGVEPTLIKGGGGIFDVVVYADPGGDRDGGPDGDGTLIYSKNDTGRFPEHAEILDKLRP